MQAELVALQPQLIKTVGEVEVLMQKISVEKREVVEPKAAVVKVDEAKAQESADAAKAIKHECEADLAEVRAHIIYSRCHIATKAGELQNHILGYAYTCTLAVDT